MKVSYPKILVTAAGVGLVASFWQAVERVNMLKNPDAPLSCNLSPVVDCGSVMGDKLAAVLGPPNAFIGMVVFSMLLALGMQRLGGGWSPSAKRLSALLVVVLTGFSVWFFGVSLYVLGKICIFCIFIWAASMPIALYSLKDHLDELKKPKGRAKKVKDFLAGNHLTALIAIYGVMVALFLLRFKDYYFG